MSTNVRPQSWFLTDKEIPSLASPLVYFARIIGLLLGFLFTTYAAHYFLKTMGDIFNAMANFLLSTIMIIAVCIFGIYIIKKSLLLRQFLMFLLVGVLLAIIIANPMVQQALGVAMANTKFGMTFILLMGFLVILSIWLLSRRYAMVRKSDVTGYQKARKRMR